MKNKKSGSNVCVAFGFVMAAVITGHGQSPLIHWTFEGGAATNIGSGGAAYDATVFGNTAFTDGIDGGGLRFLGGSAGYAALTHTFGNQGTVAFWYKPARFYDFNSLFDNSVNADQWEMWIYSYANVRFRCASAQGDCTYADLNAGYNGTNQWYHFAVTWDRYASTNHARLYINGVERQKANITSWVTPGTTVYFGGHTGNTPGEGVLDDVRIYTNTLTASQVQAVHNDIAAQSPVVRVSLDGAVTNSGTGGARYNATLYGSPVWTNGLNNKGQSLNLDGSDDYASVPYRLPASGSITLWYYAPAPWYNYNTLFDNSVSGNDYECWIASTGTGGFRAGQITGTASYAYPSSNRWYHIVATWDALSSNTVLYVDGVERQRVVNTTGASWPVAGTNFFVGGGNTLNTKGKGRVSDLQIFETPLSSNRVAEIYSQMGQRGGLLAYVPFDGTAVNVVNSNAVTLGGSPSYVRTQGGFYKGLSCGGVGTGDNASISNVLGSSVGTIALWYYARTGYDYQTIFDNPANGNFWESWIYADARLDFRIIPPNGGRVSYDLDNLKGLNNWYHIAYVWDRAAQQVRLYVDGVLRTTATLTDADWGNPSPTLVLAGGPDNTKGNGIWDEVRVYDRALTDAEIVALTVIPPPLPPQGTIIRVF